MRKPAKLIVVDVDGETYFCRHVKCYRHVEYIPFSDGETRVEPNGPDFFRLEYLTDGFTWITAEFNNKDNVVTLVDK